MRLSFLAVSRTLSPGVHQRLPPCRVRLPKLEAALQATWLRRVGRGRFAESPSGSVFCRSPLPSMKPSHFSRSADRPLTAPFFTVAGFVLLACMGTRAQAQIPAFPGAEGFGAYANGGRGGDVYVVTNLNSSGAGSLRYGIENAPTSGGRTIVFAVSGYIPISYNSDTGNQSLRIVRNNVTIAGQTAPGDGIGLKDGRILVTGNNCVIRNIRVRHGKYGGAGDCLNVDDTGHDTILDHVSMQFGTDEVISMYDSNPVDDLTMQSSIAAWGLESHSKGGLWSVQDASCVDSLWAHNTDRNPKAQPWGLLEWINNVTLDYGVGFQMGSTSTPASFKANVIGNYFIHSRYGDSSLALEQARIDRNGNYNFSLWLDDCLHDSNLENYPSSQSGVLNGTDKGYSIVEGSAWSSSQSYSEGDYVYFKRTTAHTGSTGNVAVSVVDPRTALKKVVSDAGAVRLDAAFGGDVHDEVDALLMDDVINQRRRQINGEYNLPVSNSGFGTLSSSPAPGDIDQDGMPDAWETALGWNPAVDDHGVVFGGIAGTFFPAGTAVGYTRLEEYLHFKSVPHIFVGKNTAEVPSSFTTDLRKFTSGFSSGPVFSVTGVYGGAVEQFASNGVTPSATGPIVKFTPTEDSSGRAGFQFTVTDSEGSSWTRQFAILVTQSVATPPEVRINVDFNEGSVYSGTAAAPDAGTVWNSFAEKLGVTSHTLMNVAASNGSATPYDVSISTDGPELKVYTQTSLGNPSPLELMKDYGYGGTFTVTVSELPEGTYQLYVYGHGDQAAQGSTVAIDASNGGGSATAGTTGTEYRNLTTTGAEGYSYLRFEPTVGPSGTLVFTVASYFNGFQLVTPPTGNYFVNMTDSAGSTGSTQAIPSMPGWGYSAAAPVAGETWNVFNETNFNSSFPNPVNVGQTWTVVSDLPLTTADGLDKAARMKVVYHAVTDALTSDRLNTISSVGIVQPGGVMEKLMRNYWDRGGSGNFQRISLSGLTPNAGYLLYVYGASGGTFRSWIDLNQDGTVDFDTDDDLAGDALFVDNGGGNYGLTAQGHVWNLGVESTDASGNLVFDSRGHLNGFQVIEYEAPQILSQPADLEIGEGQQAVFSVEATARPEPFYQWYKDDAPIPGANGSSYLVTGAQASDLGDYKVEVSNPGATVVSMPATLSFPDPFRDYVGGYGLDPETDGGEDEDPDLDGLSNKIEFFLGRNPTLRDGPDDLPTGDRSVSPGGLVFQFDRFKPAAGLSYVVEYSVDLSSGWTIAEDGVDGVVVDVAPLDDDFDRVTVTIPTAAARIFARLRL